MKWSVLRRLFTVDRRELQRIFAYFFHECVRFNAEDLFEKMVELGLLTVHSDGGGQVELFVLEWFLTIFVKPLELDTAAVAWDEVVRLGQGGLFRVAVAVFVEIKADLMEHRTFDDFLEALVKLPRRIRPKNLRERTRLVEDPGSLAMFLAQLDFVD
jgi:hypothetical protein